MPCDAIRLLFGGRAATTGAQGGCAARRAPSSASRPLLAFDCADISPDSGRLESTSVAQVLPERDHRGATRLCGVAPACPVRVPAGGCGERGRVSPSLARVPRSDGRACTQSARAREGLRSLPSRGRRVGVGLIGCAGHLVGGGADRGARPARRRAGRAGPSSLSRGTPPRARTATPEVRAPDLSLSSR
jgi:hypothetical protein